MDQDVPVYLRQLERWTGTRQYPLDETPVSSMLTDEDHYNRSGTVVVDGVRVPDDLLFEGWYSTADDPTYHGPIILMRNLSLIHI